MIRSYIYSVANGTLKEESDLKKLARELRNKKTTVWVDFEEPTKEELETLRSVFGFHPLALEDIIQGSQRPKVEAYEDYVFIVAYGLDDADKAEQMNIFLGKDFLVTVNRKPIPKLNEAFERVKKNPIALKRGHDFLAYIVLDTLVDSFFPTIERMDDRLDALEDRIFKESSGKEVLEELFALKHKIIAIRRIALPLRDLLNVLARRDFDYIKASNSVYYRDVYDHLVRIAEMTDSLRDLLSSTMEGYLSVVSNNLNFVMKKLAAITVILMLPTLITGFYGMNVANLPIADHALSPEIITGVIIATAFGSYLFFHKLDWI